MNAKEKIEELALRVAEDALADSASPEDRREALKILNPHYTMLLRSKAKTNRDWMCNTHGSRQPDAATCIA